MPTTYVALLRGINVGGNNKVEMKSLKLLFEALGFKKVGTYINSGNVIFTSTEKNPEKVTKKIETGIKKKFGLEIRVVVRDFKNIQKICKSLPTTWQNNDKVRTEVMFLWPEVDSPKVIGELPINPAVDHVKYLAGTVVWNFDRKDYTKSKLSKLIGTKIYRHMTGRNVNTVRKLEKLMSVV